MLGGISHLGSCNEGHLSGGFRWISEVQEWDVTPEERGMLPLTKREEKKCRISPFLESFKMPYIICVCKFSESNSSN